MSTPALEVEQYSMVGGQYSAGIGSKACWVGVVSSGMGAVWCGGRQYSVVGGSTAWGGAV